MKLISHRGNTIGPNLLLENSPDYILKALRLGFDVEIDVWLINNKFYLGHDKPAYEINIVFLKNEKLWCHAKNLDALEKMISNNIHCFWHQNDDVTLTSKNYVWTFPGKPLIKNSIAVILSKKDFNFQECEGICSDDILYIKQELRII